jgi:uncharacterized membrane protein
MNHKTISYHPFFDPRREGKPLSWAQKLGLSVTVGAVYSLFQFLNLYNKAVFFEQYAWILSIIISTSLLALYMATAVFRNSLSVMLAHDDPSGSTEQFLRRIMTNRNYIAFGLFFGLTTCAVSQALGIPVSLGEARLPFLSYYLGCMLTGFASGMGLWGIFSIIALYVRLAPNLQYTLDPDNPDGKGGIKALGDSLWVFASLLFLVGLLVAIYMFNAEWTNLQSSLGRALFLFWLAMPFVLAISIVLIPGLAVRRQVDEFKHRKQEELKKERAEVYSSYKEFEQADDEEIIANKRALQDRLNSIQLQMEKLQHMGSSLLDFRKKS